ncbi:hypothetical protein [Winogradskyella sp. UBA3174]|uniref:hypothetical protein n=1 Tax=Winogradskyella sp. UBA3174 TaxID=1947785 RepID=UPI0025EEC462|nr:hypothetical protein [Winogradskyella sp. UBA3174]|tara:strand:+ start:43684 stop:44415 length:732 start_codon:yes stop_codon:yes gene_type:complete
MKSSIYIFCIIVLCSCKPLAAKLILGVDTTPEWQTNGEIEQAFKNYEIPEINRFVLDTAVYSKNVISKVYKTLDKLKSKEVAIDSVMKSNFEESTSDNLQPVQVRYFDSLGLPIFKLVNCYVDNPYKMDWNVDGAFDSYPPYIDNAVLNFKNQELSFFMPMLSKINGEKVTLAEVPKSEYYAIVFWNDFFKKPSKKLIDKIQAIENDRENTFVFYVNNNNSEIYELIPEDERAVYFENLKTKL